MLNENNRSSDRILTERILDDPDMILNMHRKGELLPVDAQQMAAVQKKPELIASLPLAGEKVQLAAVIACPESILLVDTPAPAACFMAVERMLKEELLPVPGVLNAARELILQMKKDKADGRSSGAAIETFLDENEELSVYRQYFENIIRHIRYKLSKTSVTFKNRFKLF